ncbi:MAG: aminotransferase class IV, partial [Solirubrobacteraceae bacterium]|nr:aminotransferase class IV [Solirubrobacteraceae bacterium]
HKWADRRLVDALAEAGGATALLLDADGAVLEAGWANVFLLDGDRLHTAPDDGRILPGVTRARLLALAPELGLEVVEQAPALEVLAGAPGLLLTSALRMAVPARVLGARAPAPDPRIAQLATALARGVAAARRA